MTSENKIRSFVSIDLPNKVKEEIKNIQELLPEFIGKKTESENLHLTLKFLGEIPEEKILAVKEKLRKIKYKKFEIKIDSIGFFSPKFIRIIWLHLKGAERLQTIIDEELSGIFEREKRFMSHLTIARVKKIRNKKKFIEKMNSMIIKEINFLVENFKLKKSTLTEKGPIYEDLEVYSLE